jgi:malonyl-CoA/methylmalonyl-CoA synthetase
MNQNLYALFAKHFQPAAIAFELEDGTPLSYAGLESETARYANLLRALGLAPGDRVVAQVEKSLSAVLLYLGCLRAGCVFVPLNTAYQAREISYFIGDAKPRLVVGRTESAEALGKLAREAGVGQVLALDANGAGSLASAAAAQSTHFDTVPCAKDDLAAIVYTSGTTGRSKGAMLSHGNLASNAEVLHACWAFQPGDVLLHALPIYHVHGLMVALHTALLNSSRIVFLRKFDAADVLRRLPDATVFMGVPTMYVRLLAEAGLHRAACAGMRLFVSGSAPLLNETFDSFRTRTGHTILERYGMSETNMNTSNPYTGERRGGTVGFPLPGTALRIANDRDEALAAGEIGEIQVRGPNVMSGYWGMPGKNAEAFAADGYFRTGDLGRIDAEGYVSIVGRAKDLVISGGLNVYPKEVELLLDALPGVEESAVFGVPHADFGEAVTAAIVPRPGATLDEAGVLAQVKGELAAFKLPKRIHIVDALPRNAMGKVQKNLLRERYGKPGA